MKRRTKEITDEVIAAIEEHVSGDVDVTGFTIEEYIRGDPTTEDATVTGAEIEVNAYASLDNSDNNDESRFRVK